MSMASAAPQVTSPTPPRDQLKGYAAALTMVMIWAAFMLISRLGGKSSLTGLDIAAIRLGFGSLFLLPFAFSIPRTAWIDPKLWVLAMSGGAGFMLLVFLAFKFAPASHGGILSPGSQPFLVTLAGYAILGTRPDRTRLLALIPIALGIVIVAGPGFFGTGFDKTIVTGDALLLASSAIWAVYSVLARKWAYDAWLVTRFLCLASTLVYLPFYLLFAQKGIAETSWSMLLTQIIYQGLVMTILAMRLFLYAVKSLGAERTGALIALVPPLTSLGAVMFLDEPLTVPLLVGMALVSSGAYLAARPSRSIPAVAPASERLQE